jgi:hypothetical protein
MQSVYYTTDRGRVSSQNLAGSQPHVGFVRKEALVSMKRSRGAFRRCPSSAKRLASSFSYIHVCRELVAEQGIRIAAIIYTVTGEPQRRACRIKGTWHSLLLNFRGSTINGTRIHDRRKNTGRLAALRQAVGIPVKSERKPCMRNRGKSDNHYHNEQT